MLRARTPPRESTTEPLLQQPPVTTATRRTGAATLLRGWARSVPHSRHGPRIPALSVDLLRGQRGLSLMGERRPAVAVLHDRIEEGEGSGTAVQFAFREAYVRRCRLVAVHAWSAPLGALTTPQAPSWYALEAHRRPPAQVLDDALRDASEQYRDAPVSRRVIEGPARQALLEAASEADLLVVGARRRQGHLGLQPGLINHAVLHHAPCPIAVVPRIWPDGRRRITSTVGPCGAGSRPRRDFRPWDRGPVSIRGGSSGGGTGQRLAGGRVMSAQNPPHASGRLPS